MHPALLHHHRHSGETFAPATFVSLYHRLLWAVHDRIATLDLRGLPRDGVLVRKLPIARELTSGRRVWPAIIVSPSGLSARHEGGTNRRDDVVYPVRLTLLAADNEDPTSNLDRYLQWREWLARAFRHQRLPGADEVLTCEVEARDAVSATAHDRGVFHWALDLHFLVREPRRA